MVHTVRINDRTKMGKELLNYLGTLPFVELEDKPRYNAETMKGFQEALEGMKNGTNIKVKDTKDLMKKLRA